MAGERANVRGCGERGAWRPGSLCMAGVRGGALAMRNFSGFGLHGARKSVPNSPAWRLRLRKMRQLNQLPPPPTRPLGSYLVSEWDTCGSADRTSSREGRSWASSPFSEAKGTVSESGDGAQNTGREAAWAHLVPGASGGGVRGRALAFGNFSDSACRALGKNVRRRGPPRVKSRKLRSGEQPPAGQTTAAAAQPPGWAGQPPPPCVEPQRLFNAAAAQLVQSVLGVGHANQSALLRFRDVG